MIEIFIVIAFGAALWGIEFVGERIRRLWDRTTGIGNRRLFSRSPAPRVGPWPVNCARSGRSRVWVRAGRSCTAAGEPSGRYGVEPRLGGR
jgi:hypothetical protein